jgi:hypothetical protein
VACIEFPFLVLFMGVAGLFVLGFWAGVVVGPVVGLCWYLWTARRRAAIQSRLTQLGWPRIWLGPDLLMYPDWVWSRLPVYELMAVIPNFSEGKRPRRLLWKTLQALEDHRNDEVFDSALLKKKSPCKPQSLGSKSVG